MIFTDFLRRFSNNKSTTQFKYDTSYCILEYSSKDKDIKEFFWNATDLQPPTYIFNITETEKLFYRKIVSKRIPNYTPVKGERYFAYKLPENYIREKAPILKFYWNNNFLECQKYYSSYEEFFAISCSNMNNKRLEVKIG